MIHSMEEDDITIPCEVKWWRQLYIIFLNRKYDIMKWVSPFKIPSQRTVILFLSSNRYITDNRYAPISETNDLTIEFDHKIQKHSWSATRISHKHETPMSTTYINETTTNCWWNHMNVHHQLTNMNMYQNKEIHPPWKMWTFPWYNLWWSTSRSTMKTC